MATAETEAGEWNSLELKAPQGSPGSDTNLARVEIRNELEEIIEVLEAGKEASTSAGRSFPTTRYQFTGNCPSHTD